MMGEAIEERTGEAFRTEYGGPFIEWQVAGDQSGTAFIALAEHLEEQLGTDSRERHVAQFVDDQQLDGVEMLLQGPEAALITGFHEFVHEGGGRGEGDAVSLLAGGQSQGQGDVSLAGAGGRSAIQFWRLSIDSQRASSRTSALLSEVCAAKSKVSRLLVWGKRASWMRRSTLRRSRSMRSSSHRRSR